MIFTVLSYHCPIFYCWIKEKFMAKVLIIAEKPSVAGDIAKVLASSGSFEKTKDYFESVKYVITSAVGHLIEIAAPENMEVKRGKWSLVNLPVIPPEFALKPIEKTEARLKVIQKLCKRSDISEIINACDAGREGELIFTYIMKYIKNAKPVKRLWLQSMTAGAINEGFTKLRPEVKMRGLRDAAMCRSEADWLIGINGTRALTAFNSKGGGFFLTTVGRVQTPTLTLVVEREKLIRQFVSKPFWKIAANFNSNNGEYLGFWFDEKFDAKKSENAEEKADRLWKKADAEAIINNCQNQPITFSEQAKKTTQLSPLLYDLTSLQREANSRFGFSAKNTLGLAQALYERHKAITYPRTDSRYLPEDYIKTVRDVLANTGTPYKEFAQKILKNNGVFPNKRIFDNKKVSDHFAIIPTGNVDKLNEQEEKIYSLIMRRFLSVFYPPAEYLITTRITKIGNEPFKTEGKILTTPGWLEVYGKDIDSADSGNLPKLGENEKLKLNEIKLEEDNTRPPARLNEATLLSAMEGAGKIIDDEELRAAMQEKGLGTPATRAQIIEGLIIEEYIIREQKNLIPTAKAFSLMNLLKGLEVTALTSAELTAKWEHQLGQIEIGEYDRQTFMRGIGQMAKHIVDMAKAHENDTLQGDYVDLQQPCPKCGGVIRENYRYYQCQKCDFSVNKVIAGRVMTVDEVDELIQKKTSSLLKGFRSKMGRPFEAQLKMDKDAAVTFHFEGSESAGEIEWSSTEPLGKCPKCQNKVLESVRAFACEKTSGADKSCTFRIAKTILHREINYEQAVKLINNGKTDLLEKFISKKGRPFKAFLVMKKDGDIGFEFDNSKSTNFKSAKPASSTASTKSASKIKKSTPIAEVAKVKKVVKAKTVKVSTEEKKTSKAK